MSKTIVVIGGGAAGFFSAVNVARLVPEAKVILLEKSKQFLAKVKISGGGRCNLTHNHTQISAMAKCYPRGEAFVKKTFSKFFVPDTIDWFAQRGMKTKAEADGRMFPESNTSQSVIDVLLQEANVYGVQCNTSIAVENIEQKENQFVLNLSTYTSLVADYVIIACGGYPKAEHFGWLQSLGHSIQSPIPSLFTFNAKKEWLHKQQIPIINLMGVVANNATIKIQGSKLQSNGALLITHWGISGPAVLTLSAFAARHLHEAGYMYNAIINWISDYNETSFLEKLRQLRNELGSQKVIGKNSFDLPNRLWEYLCILSGIEQNTTWSTMNATQQNTLAKHCCSYVFEANGKTTFKEEFVTAGGITLSEVDASTCESKLIKNLYFAGEILDVDGKTGGFNFQHAWSSAWCAATAISTQEN
jgi:predicted Rossmann fold flavoprotein